MSFGEHIKAISPENMPWKWIYICRNTWYKTSKKKSSWLVSSYVFYGGWLLKVNILCTKLKYVEVHTKKLVWIQAYK